MAVFSDVVFGSPYGIRKVPQSCVGRGAVALPLVPGSTFFIVNGRDWVTYVKFNLVAICSATQLLIDLCAGTRGKAALRTNRVRFTARLSL
jgi:hypothetical protein